MSTRHYGTLVVIGSGPGIGNHVAAAFAAKGFNHIVLLARNEERLEQDKAVIVSKAGKPDIFIDTIKVDISDATALQGALRKLEKVEHAIECIFFNAARVVPGELLLESVETIEEDFKTTNIALYIVAQWAIPRLQALAASSTPATPSLLVTNSLLYADPIPQLFSLSLVKAAQRSLVMSLAKTFNSSGIHIALITVGGDVAPENKHLNPRNIADQTWELFDQEKDTWGWEVEILE